MFQIFLFCFIFLQFHFHTLILNIFLFSQKPFQSVSESHMSAPLVSLLIILFAPLPLGFFHILISGFLFCDLFKHENLKKKPSHSNFALAVFALCLQEHRLKYCVHLYLQAVYHQECSANELGGLDCSSRFTSGVFRLCIHI